jgi:ferredoxin
MLNNITSAAAAIRPISSVHKKRRMPDQPKVLVCSCEDTMPLDGARLAKACRGLDLAPLATQLCRRELERFADALGDGRPVIVACTQEASRFEEQREELGVAQPVGYVNIRERAGWSDEAGAATPKIAALLAEAALDIKPADTVTMKSDGVALIYGRDERAIEAARQLQDRLNLTVLLTRPDEVAPPPVMDVPVLRGTIVAARGYLGAFDITVDDYAMPRPSSRAALAFETPRDGARSRCDLILDLSGGTPLFRADQKRDGYFRPDPDNPVEVQKALFRMAEMVGEFEKPRYIAYDAAICVHGRSGKTGCSRCLDSCPTGAISPKGDKVEYDAFVCAGCGACAAVCPTGAAGYRLPAPDQLLLRVRTLLAAYHEAGGSDAVLLIHDAEHGAPLIDMLARVGRGLPARVLPFAVNQIPQLGIDFYSGAFAYGAAAMRVLAPARRRDDLAPLAEQFGLMEAVLGGLGHGSGRIGLIETDDPDALGAALYDLPRQRGVVPSSFLPMGGKRGLTSLALRHLHAVAPTPVDVLALPKGAPFGAVKVNVEGCTLCLACVSACPTGALGDNPDRPMLRFTEEACVQCGLCRNTCPERVIELVPRLSFAEEARRAVVVKEEEPFHCVRCGKPFGTKGSVEHTIEKLSGKHWMYAQGDMIERIKMCADCRVIAQTESTLDPHAGPPRPAMRTSDDYRAELIRKAEEGKLDDDA